MTTPALQEHKPRELTDVLIADRERLRKWIEYIREMAQGNSSYRLGTRISTACWLALKGEDAP